MKASVLNSHLKQGLKLANCAIDKKVRMPVLGTTLLSANSDGTLSITGTNLGRGVRVTMPAIVEDPGSACIPASALDTRTKEVESRLDIALDPTSLTVSFTNGMSKSASRGIAGEEFPVIQRVGSDEFAIVGGKTLKNAIRFVLEATRNDKFTDAYAVVHLRAVGATEDTPGKIILTATDGLKIHRAVVTDNSTGNYESAFASQDYTVIIPADSMEALAKMLPDNFVNLCKMQHETPGLGATWTDPKSHLAVEFQSMAADVKALNYDSVIPPDYVWSFQVQAEVLRSAVKHCKVMSDTVTLNLNRTRAEDGTLSASAYLYSEWPGVGDATDEFEIAYNVAPPTRAYPFEARNLLETLETLSKVTDGSVTVRFNAYTAPVFIEATEGNLALSAAVMLKRTVVYAPPVWRPDEGEAHWRDLEAAEKVYLDWIRDTFGLPARVAADERLSRGSKIYHYGDTPYYDVITAYEHIYEGGPAPAFQSRQKMAA